MRYFEDKSQSVKIVELNGGWSEDTRQWKERGETLSELQWVACVFSCKRIWSRIVTDSKVGRTRHDPVEKHCPVEFYRSSFLKIWQKLPFIWHKYFERVETPLRKIWVVWEILIGSIKEHRKGERWRRIRCFEEDLHFLQAEVPSDTNAKCRSHYLSWTQNCRLRSVTFF